MSQTGSHQGGGHWPVGVSADVHGGDQRRARGPVTTEVSGAAFVVSVLFTVLLIVAPEQLTAAYEWIRGLPIVLEVVAWVLLLPWILAHMAWETAWALWIRLALVLFLVWGVALSFWRNNGR